MTATSLDKIFPGGAFIDVLLFFVLHPDEETYLARIVRATGKILIQVQRAIKRLEASGLVQKIKRADKAYYKANASHPAFKDLKQMLIKGVIFSAKFNKERSLLEDKIVFGFIFGSTAKNFDTPESDIDLFLVGNLTHEQVSVLTFPLSLELGRAVNSVIYTLKEFKSTLQQPFIAEVIRSPKIWLFGNEHEFEKICR